MFTTALSNKEISEEHGLEGPNVPFSYQWLNNVNENENNGMNGVNEYLSYWR